jgi:putative membrane protein
MARSLRHIDDFVYRSVGDAVERPFSPHHRSRHYSGVSPAGMFSVTRRAPLLLLVSLPAVAWAHHTASADSSPWRNEVALWAPLTASGLWYGIGFVRLLLRVSSVNSAMWRNGLLFALGWSTLVASLVSPLHELGEISFTAHMTEHELLMLVAAPLMALARPVAVFLWACPHSLRQSLIRACGSGPVSRTWKLISAPIVATILQIGALWLWHTPSLFNRALQSEGWHAIQHLSFLISALLFWWSLNRGSHRANRRATAAVCLFITSMASGALGALMAFSASPWYEGYAVIGLHGLLPGSLTAAEDQQLAGLIMWIPGGLVHFVAALIFAHRGLRQTTVRKGAPVSSHA